MIKSVHKLLVPTHDADYKALVDFFIALGLSVGEAWDGKRSRGTKLEAPESGIEIGIGKGFPNAGLVVEVDNADVLYELVRKRGWKVVDEIADADWGARLFTVAMPAGAGKLAIFSYKTDWRQPKKEGQLHGQGLRFAIVVSRFNAFITERLLSGALDALHRTGVFPEHIEVVGVPGAFEIPAAARALAQTGKYNAIVCVGCLLRGDTAHYDVIVNECARGIGQSAQETGVPHAFGVLTCDTLEQAIDRAGLKMGNKGFEAGLAAVEMANLNKAIGRKPSAVRKSKQRVSAQKRSSKRGRK
jgi:6,7-dimethyl-8-ribityllumazine synthase